MLVCTEFTKIKNTFTLNLKACFGTIIWVWVWKEAGSWFQFSAFNQRPMEDYFSPFYFTRIRFLTCNIQIFLWLHITHDLKGFWFSSVGGKHHFFSLPPPALHMACIGQHAEAAKTLLQLGLKDSEDALGTTAQQHAKKLDIVKVFECDEQDAWVHREVLGINVCVWWPRKRDERRKNVSRCRWNTLVE